MYSSHLSMRKTPQSEPVFGKDQVQNSAGGNVFKLDQWEQLNRFLILGCEGGTFYTNERNLTFENSAVVQSCVSQDHGRFYSVLKDINDNNRAIKHDTVLFAYALLCKDQSQYLADILDFCRIGTHLFTFAQMTKDLRGWGRAVRRAFSKWYNEHKSTEYQMAKYQGRNGWTHRDVLRQSHVKPETENIAALLRWAVSGEVPTGGMIEAMQLARSANENEIAALIRDKGLPRECIPTDKLKSLVVWQALLEKMPMTAMIRNLGKMSSIGLLTPMNEAVQFVSGRLRDAEYIRKSRVHPFSILLALKTYASGQGFRGSLTWPVDRSVLESLNVALATSFENVEPSGKRFYFGIDVSGSMGALINNTNVSCREAAAVLALASIKNEPFTYSAGFTGGGWGSQNTAMTELQLTQQDTFQSVVEKTSRLPFGRTDCSLPMLDAMKKKIPVDTFVILTDNETWCGGIHPFQALKQYRAAMGIDAKLVVVGMTATRFTIADPSDAGMLDVVGFDASGPKIVSEFATA